MNDNTTLEQRLTGWEAGICGLRRSRRPTSPTSSTTPPSDGSCSPATTPALVATRYVTDDEAVDAVLDRLAHSVSPRVLPMPAALDDARHQFDDFLAGRLHDFDLEPTWRSRRRSSAVSWRPWPARSGTASARRTAGWPRPSAGRRPWPARRTSRARRTRPCGPGSPGHCAGTASRAPGRSRGRSRAGVRPGSRRTGDGRRRGRPASGALAVTRSEPVGRARRRPTGRRSRSGWRPAPRSRCGRTGSGRRRCRRRVGDVGRRERRGPQIAGFPTGQSLLEGGVVVHQALSQVLKAVADEASAHRGGGAEQLGDGGVVEVPDVLRTTASRCRSGSRETRPHRSSSTRPYSGVDPGGAREDGLVVVRHGPAAARAVQVHGAPVGDGQQPAAQVPG